MPIDLNVLPNQHGELLPDLNILPDQYGELLHDLNEAPAHEQEDEDTIPHLQEHQIYEDEAPLQDQHRDLLPDLNEEPAYEEEDEIAHLKDIQLHEDEAHLQGEPLHLPHDELLGMHVIDLNVDALEGKQEHHEADLFLFIASGQQ